MFDVGFFPCAKGDDDDGGDGNGGDITNDCADGDDGGDADLLVELELLSVFLVGTNSSVGG